MQHGSEPRAFILPVTNNTSVTVTSFNLSFSIVGIISFVKTALIVLGFLFLTFAISSIQIGAKSSTVSNALSSRLAFCFCLCLAGEIPLATNFLASSLFPLASNSEKSGYSPKVIFLVYHLSDSAFSILLWF